VGGKRYYLSYAYFQQKEKGRKFAPGEGTEVGKIRKGEGEEKVSNKKLPHEKKGGEREKERGKKDIYFNQFFGRGGGEVATFEEGGERKKKEKESFCLPLFI